MSRSTHLITVAELSAELAATPDPHVELAHRVQPGLHIWDVRWTLAQPDGGKAFAAGHIPTAVYISLDEDLSTHTNAGNTPTPATAGRHPLPDFLRFTMRLAQWGLCPDSQVVVYDDAAGMGAARAWWLLRWAGVKNVRVLDGGWAAWQDAGQPTATGFARPTEAPHTRSDTLTNPFSDSPALPTMDADQAAAWAASGVLLDARAPERYRGEIEPMDPRAGHIPGALNRPAIANMAGSYWRSNTTLAADFAKLGIDARVNVGVYCGSGVTACHNALALAVLGIESTLYPASWSGWSADPNRPVAEGDA